MSAGESPTENHKNSRKWSIQDAADFYNIEGWGADYFSINDLGNLCMRPAGLEGPSIQIVDVVQEIHNHQLELPCIIRFQDILRNRVERLNQSFHRAISELEYQGVYRGVYPIKVNQMKEVIEEILDAGRPYHYGLEAGSKAELQIVLAYNQDPEALTICNGYKDRDYLRLALMGVLLGRKVVVVVEKATELPLILQMSKEMGVRPLLGIRGKLATQGTGKWQDSGGDRAKFGLSTAEIVKVVELLRADGMLDCLQLFHFHIGSQIPDIQTIRTAVTEGARYYSSLRQLGAPIQYLDVGGGLGVDYDGSQSKTHFSMNYSLDEYVRDIVNEVKSVCDEEKVPHPTLVSESGRAVVAHHSCLIMNVVDAILPSQKKAWQDSPILKDSSFVQDVQKIFDQLSLRNALRSYHDAMAKEEEAVSLFKWGHLSMGERALVEQIVSDICQWIIRNMRRMKRVPDEFYELESRKLQQYVVNFSVFQSAPDHWAFDQLFPIVPIHRMGERPKSAAILVDITCDSDGEIDRFVDRSEEYSPYLGLHSFKEGKDYYLGMFMTGAYQDIIGDMHNLFGRVNEVHVFTDDDDPEDFYVEEVIRGDTIGDMIKANQYSTTELNRLLKIQVDQRVKEGAMKPKEGVQLLELYSRVLQSYTYLRKS
ncbi:MAG: biosynthetic arginine decarboxylase [Bradymonadales bacterium]|nr:MAG: biosynthetic arginine decarboxylase [Bradymonadales bacterium]